MNVTIDFFKIKLRSNWLSNNLVFFLLHVIWRNDFKRSTRIRFHRNDIVFNENVTIVLHLHIVFVPFSFCSLWRLFLKVIVFSRFLVDTMWKRKEKFAVLMKTIWKRICFQWKRNDCLASTHRLRIVLILFSLEAVFKTYRFQSFSCKYNAKTQREVCGFDENDMKTYLCRRGPKTYSTPIRMNWNIKCIP